MEESNYLSDRAFWKNYWANYSFDVVPDRHLMLNYLPSICKDRSSLEIGGFPGFLTMLCAKQGFSDLSLLDFYIDKAIIDRLLKQNGLSVDIHTIESDFLFWKPDRKYDFVFSMGFIEHFKNTHEMIERHLQAVASGGKCLIIIPNFLGLNGWLQRLFDRRNLEAHNLECMEMNRLNAILSSVDCRSYSVDYYRKPMLWLEPQKGIVRNVLRRCVKLLSYFLKLFPIKSRLLSPYIVMEIYR